MKPWVAVAAIVVGVLAPASVHAAERGRIEGTVTKDGAGVGGVVVLVNETGASTLTDAKGVFTLTDVPEGVYTVTLALGARVATENNVRVTAGQTLVVAWKVPWTVGFAETITVVSASRRRERIVDAPGAMTTVTPSAMELLAPSGQLPNLLARTAGAEVTQNGLYDFNFNTHGFNGFLTRRIQTIVDGRDPSIPGTSSQEWWTVDPLNDDLESVELARGPSAALYGPNSFNGVLNIITKAPRGSEGLRVRLVGGELATMKANVRWAGPVGGDWFVKAQGSHTQSHDFATSRVTGGEYDGLPAEVLPLRSGGIHFNSGSLRADRVLPSGRLFTVEGGIAAGDGEVAMTSAGRAQQRDITRTWARSSYTESHWNVTAAFNRRIGDSVLLSAGVPLLEQGSSVTFDGQAHQTFWRGRARAVGGASYARKVLDSVNAQGVETLYTHKITSHQGAAFGQFDVDLTKTVKLVTAGRWDDSTLHPSQFSPKAALVYAVRPSHKLRIGYNQAFQVANYTELFADVPAAPPADLSALEAAFAPALGGASLGFAAVPVRAQGNALLDVEKIRALDAGYSGVFGSRVLVTIDYHYERLSDFISGYLPGGNPHIPLYHVPLAIPASLAAVIDATANGAVPGLTNSPDGKPAIVVSPGNSGRVSSQGVEVAFDYFVGSSWRMSASYAALSFKALDLEPGAEVFLNAPKHRVNFGVSYTKDKLALDAGVRSQNAFYWSSGVFTGPVPAFGVVDVNARYRVASHAQLGATVSNALDNRHYEAFGADVLRRLALVYLTFSY